MPDITAIETQYNGYRFRSRTEARWAVFFDALGMPYEYEREGFVLDGRPYLPDFWLPELGCWVEIKGQRPTDQEEALAHALAQATGKDVYVFYGSIEDNASGRSDGAFKYFAGGGWDNYHTWCECPKCGALGIQFSGASNRNCQCAPAHGDAGYNLPWPPGKQSRLAAAYAAAKAARFEHGETPVPPRR
jgi:hypothetical protein